MKKILSFLFVLTFCTAPCHAQFGSLIKIYKDVKAAKKAQKAEKKVEEAQPSSDVPENPYLKKMQELKDDSVALKKYMEEEFGGMSADEVYRKMSNGSVIDTNSKDYQDNLEKAQKMSSLHDDPVYKKIMAEQRQPTIQEATYLNEKYGTSFEYEGMEAYDDSIGVYAHMNGKMEPINVTKYRTITDELPLAFYDQDEIEQHLNNHLSIMREQRSNKVIIDSVQNYMIYDNRHADKRFTGTAKFTIYSNLNSARILLKNNFKNTNGLYSFMKPIDPQRIFVFKVHKGIDCRYMEYQYSKITYKQSELVDYIKRRLIADGYIDANIDRKISDEQLLRAIDLLAFQFKMDKLLKIRKNNEKFSYTNTIPAAKNAILKSNTRRVGGHVTALDISIDAEPGEYAFVILKPEVEEHIKHWGDDEEDENTRKLFQNFDISVLTNGAFFFTIKK